MNHQGDRQQQMSDAEVMTTAIVAVLYFGRNFEKARKDLSKPQYIPKMLSRSRFNRRLYRVESMLLMLFECLRQAWKQPAGQKGFVVQQKRWVVERTFATPRLTSQTLSR
ncbi:hypothetical protein [Pseudanabaena mucicola]|uniref:Transposase n=1 Tax=Pseudanabaena mucicola FACHB-723 TaxID=2692860 RepID=A0ABR8A1J2_9CYAN|nr:hypothetical protein [Pseudanabaena mucicola]MBD2189615.1 hypothetical protein [Pseudanabaena mucicola FACHB-723]